MSARALAVAALALLGCARMPLQLGDDPDASVGPDAAAPPIVVIELALGGDSSCALLADGGVACWGADDRGQLALDSELWRADPCSGRLCVRTPAPSPYLGGVVELDLGAGFGCARGSDGALSCWGDDRFGQLGRGDGPDIDRHPRPIAIARDVVEVAAGRYHACARGVDGIVSCWGLAEDGRLGRAGDERCPVPEGMALELGVSAGTADVACSTHPAPVEGLGAVDRIVAGGDHTCALRAGQVWCWGRDDRGQLGDGELGDARSAPALVATAAPIDQLTLGDGASFAVDSAGSLLAWGGGSHGQLTVSPLELEECVTGRCAHSPQAIASRFVRVAPGRTHACGLDAAGRASCWGDARDGRLGVSATGECEGVPCAIAPVELPELGAGVRTIAVGDAHACALAFPTEQGSSVSCWGANARGQLGLGTDGVHVPVASPVPRTR